MAQPRRFLSTPSGSIRGSRRRLRRILLGMALPMLALAIWFFAIRRLGAGGLSLVAAFLSWFSWRMSGDLDPFWLELDGDAMVVQMRRRRQWLSLSRPVARRLTPGEVSHVERLMSSAGMIFSSGSFDSHLLGECHLFATSLENAVLVEVDDPEEEGGRVRWIVTPDEPEALISALSSN